MNFTEAKLMIEEIGKNIPTIVKYYNQEMTGTELYKSLIENSPLSIERNGHLFTDWLDGAINHGGYFGINNDELPFKSSGSFFSSWIDDGFLEEVEEDETTKPTDYDTLIAYSKSKGFHYYHEVYNLKR